MKRTFLISVAAGALLAGASVASAQMERGGADQRGGAGMEQRGGGNTEQQRGGAAAEQRGGGLEQRGPAASSPSNNNRAQSQDNKSTTGQGEPRREQGQRD